MEDLIEMKPNHLIRSFPTVKDLLSTLAEDIPDVVLIKKGEKDEEDLIEAIRAVRTKYIPIVSHIGKTKNINWETYPIDDFITEKTSPEEVSLRILLSVERANRTSDLNPLTRLPGNTSILKYIHNALKKEEDICICYIDIDNFKPFNDRYGFSRGDELILMLSRMLKSSVDSIPARSFLGHIGGDDFVVGIPRDFVDSFCKEVISNFKRLSELLIDEEDLKRGFFISRGRDGLEKKFPLPSVSIAVVPVGKGRFRHPGEIAQVAAQIKSFLKSRGGGNYLVDRRETLSSRFSGSPGSS